MARVKVATSKSRFRVYPIIMIGYQNESIDAVKVSKQARATTERPLVEIMKRSRFVIKRPVDSPSWTLAFVKEWAWKG